ncbi:hypothetical protein MKW98_007918 [Papaver atlanticum]|uniref:ATP-dependent DNA helicase n=1 Tax=Papaver atlanticum TaxID=357466 RepID=A0AAD4SJV0_9MAGN|nr:hypothetical protein MKW98_007918 [Papaver atlanticum]
MVEDELEDETHPKDEHLEEWMVAAAMAPNSRVLEDTDLGLRDIDVNHKCGGAGMGKPNLISAIVHSTRELFSNDESVRIMAPTGVASFNIGGSNVHHEVAIIADRNLSHKKLEAERCRRIHLYLNTTVDFKDTKMIIIDEYNMIGRQMLANIDLRLRDIFSTNEPFGNVSIVLVGDMRQLPLVFDTLLYAEGGGELLDMYSLLPCV